MANNIVLKAIGLNRQPNFLDPQSTPPGSLLTANNIVIRRDNIIESRRGYPLYGDAMGTSSDRAKQLMTYKGRILRHYSNKLQFDTLELNSQNQSVFATFCGNYLEPQVGRRIRFIEANGNFYFTTSEGIKKISAKTAADLTTACPFITQAGGIKAIDLTTRLQIILGNQSGFLPQDSAVAYRVVWGSTDANGNEILGTPSQRSVIYNSLQNLLLLDFNNLLLQLDNVSNNSSFPSLISDGNYFSTLSLLSTASALDLRTNLIALTAKLDTDILYANNTGSGAPLQMGATPAAISGGVATITFTSGNPQDYLVSGSHINLAGFTPASGTLNGPQVVATVTPTTITFNTSATGAVTTLNPTIHSYEYEFFTQPGVPDLLATDDQLLALQVYLQSIITQLQSEPDTGTPPTISSNSQTTFISPIELTTTANVILDISIPAGVTTNNFFQIYRSDIARATGTQVLSRDVFPNDELKLVYEAFPTQADISAGFIEVTDITPPEFAGAFLYTNATTGEGILQSNDVPPFALDINRFKNVVFYANTQTRYSTLINLLGVTNIINSFLAGNTQALTITDGVTTETFTFVTGLQEITDITTVADVAGSLAGKYFFINNANNKIPYTIYFKVAGVGTDPAIAGRTSVPVYLNTGDSNVTVANKLSAVLSNLSLDFTTSVLGHTVTVTNVNFGPSVDATPQTSGFTILVTQQGRGEDASINQVLLSTNTSPAQAVDETARSLVNVINANSSGMINAFYLSDVQSVPGQIQLEARALGQSAFYVLANNSILGGSFNPDISPTIAISTISMANPTVITTSSPHGLINKDQVVISGSNSTPSVDGLYTITYISPTSFSIPVNVTVSGNKGALKNALTTLTATNLGKVNRIYYSKLLQPEAVPAVNFIDVGAQDKAILRIFPLRDSLFVYKEDGLYRISGETAPFNLALFDLSCILLAPDSLDVSNNLLYGWSTQGIISTSESGVNIISRPIDTDILKLATSQYTNFKSATWGIGYESDNSYEVATVQNTTDTLAQIVYRYSTLTNTWTTWDKSVTCGVINSVDDRQYFGSGKENFLEQERKDFARTDYADHEHVENLSLSSFIAGQLKLTDITVINSGDVITQNQYVTVYNFNNILEKLDNDFTLSPHNYQSTLSIARGTNVRTSLDALIAKIAADPGRNAQAGALPSGDYTKYESINGTFNITNISAGNPTVITSTAHGLQTGRSITITGSNSNPSINGVFQVTVLTADTFTIPVDVTSSISSITNISAANPTHITSANHGLVNGEQILISGSNSTPSIDGLRTVTVLDSDHFTIPVNVTISGNTGSWIANTTYSVNNSNFLDVQTSFNGMVTTLNADPGVTFGNYNQILNSTLQETIVTDVNKLTKYITPELDLDFIVGPITIYNSILSEVQYSPQDMQDPLSLKHFREALMFFEDKAFSSASLSFSSDLLPAFNDIIFSGTSNGIFGFNPFGFNFFGGASNAAPYRTYIPRNAQRCRYLNVKFSHQTARERYSILGLVLVGENTQSSRAYR